MRQDDDNDDIEERIEQLRRDMDLADRQGDHYASGCASRELAQLYLAEGNTEEFLSFANDAVVNFILANRPADELDALLLIRTSGVSVPSPREAELEICHAAYRVNYGTTDEAARTAVESLLAFQAKIEAEDPLHAREVGAYLELWGNRTEESALMAARNAERAPIDPQESWVSKRSLLSSAALRAVASGNYVLARTSVEKFERPSISTDKNTQQIRRVRYVRSALAFAAQPNPRNLKSLRALRAELSRAHEISLLVSIAHAELIVHPPSQHADGATAARSILRDIFMLSGQLGFRDRYRIRYLLASLRLYDWSRAASCPYVDLYWHITPLSKSVGVEQSAQDKPVLARAERAVRNLERFAARMDYRTISDGYAKEAKRFRDRINDLMGLVGRGA